MASAGPQIGRIRVAGEKDFAEFKELLREDYPGFVLKAEKKERQVKVWAKEFEGSSIRLFKASAQLAVSLLDVYDVLHDAEYRATWDEYMLEAKDLYRIDNNNDVGYYLMKWPAPLTNRDFVNQRSWFLSEDKSEFLIMNFSVVLKELPPRPKIIRAVSFLTGYHARATPTGCHFTYLTQADVKGKLPKWLVNVATSSGAPALLAKIQKATQNYGKWKAKHKPDYKPWLKPEQHPGTVPMLAPADFDKVQDLPQTQAEEITEPDTDEAVQAELEFSAKLAIDASPSEAASEPSSP
eukprot:m.222574 g.222574  ORF g.222574 m.222574 type:complete len:295 (+) comp10788_c0_seq1:34-918(+)